MRPNALKQLLVLSLVTATSATYGATLVQNASKSFTTPTWTEDFAIPRFNSALGTLTGVSVDLSTTLRADITLNNTTAGANNLMSASLASQVTMVPPPSNFGFNLAPTVSGSANVGGNQSSTLTALTQTLNGSVNMSDLSPFLGAGNTTVRVVGAIPPGAFTFASEAGRTGTASFANQMISALLNVTYTYTPVPEASTYAALGLLAAGAAWTFRRRMA